MYLSKLLFLKEALFIDTPARVKIEIPGMRQPLGGLVHKINFNNVLISI